MVEGRFLEFAGRRIRRKRRRRRRRRRRKKRRKKRIEIAVQEL